MKNENELLGGDNDNYTDPKTRKIVLLENNSRIEMETKLGFLPKEIRDGLDRKRLQLADTSFYIIKDISGKSTIDILQGTDNKGVGLGNLANQKLEKDNWFLLSALRVRTAVNPDKESADFGHPANYVTNGELELEAGQKKLIGLTGAEIFDTRGRTDIPSGFKKFESVKIIEPQVEIKLPFKFAYAAPAQSWIRVTFYGTSVIPY